MDLYPQTPKGRLRYHDRALKELGDPADLGLRHRLAYHLCEKGQACEDLAQYTEAIEVYDDVLRRFVAPAEPALLSHVAEALMGKGNSLAKLERIEEAILVFDDVVTRCADVSDVEVQGQVAGALISKAQILEEALRPEEAIQVYEEQLRQYQRVEPELRMQQSQHSRPEPDPLEQVNRERLGALGLADEQFFSLTDAFWQVDLDELTSRIADGLLSKGKLLSKLGRTTETLQAYNELLSRFPESEAAAEGLRNKAALLGDNG